MNEQHSIPLTTAISASTPGKRALAESLYSEAEALFFNRPSRGGNIVKNRLTTKAESEGKPSQIYVQARVIDFESGFFVELSGVLDNKAGTAVTGPFMSYGRLFVSETKNPQLSNTQTKIWR